jgi:SAM-dependent methyltransferase
MVAPSHGSGRVETAPDNRSLHDDNWHDWSTMKIDGPASRWLRFLIGERLARIDRDTITSVLDFGCGQGANTAFLARAFSQATVLGTDFSRSGVELAARLYREPGLRFEFHPDTAHLAAGQFGLVTAFEVLEHVEDWRALLGQLCSAARRYVMLSFPTGRMRPFERNVGHLRNFAPGEVEAFMAGQGYKAIDACYAGFPFYSPIYRDLCNRFDIGAGNFVRGEWGLRQRVASGVFWVLFRHFSCKRRGDQFCGLFERAGHGTDRASLDEQP